MDTIFEIAFIDGKKMKVAAVNFSSAKAMAAYRRLTTEGATSHKQLAVDDKKCRRIEAATMRPLPPVPPPFNPGEIVMFWPPTPPPARNLTGYQPSSCLCYFDSCCLHPAAPRAWFGKPGCIEIKAQSDLRIKPGCALKLERKFQPPPPPPPARSVKPPPKSP